LIDQWTVDDIFIVRDVDGGLLLCLKLIKIHHWLKDIYWCFHLVL